MADLNKLSSIIESLQRAHVSNAKLRIAEMSEECQHPASVATYWISKWVDYSDKYGIGKSFFSRIF